MASWPHHLKNNKIKWTQFAHVYNFNYLCDVILNHSQIPLQMDLKT